MHLNTMRTLIAAAATMLAGSLFAGITIDGSKCVIVTSFKAPAAALKEHLDLITGLKVPIYDPKQAEKKLKGDEYVWHIGVAPDGEDAKKLVAEEGRYRLTDKAAWIWGGPSHGEERGGLYPMLEEALDVRWPWAGGISAPQGEKIVVKKTEGGWKPPFRIRSVRMGNDKDSVAWRERMRVAGGSGAGRPAYGHAFSDYWERFGYNKLHPEYFAMRADGKRMPMNVSDDTAYNIAASKDKPARYISMCVSSEAFIDQVVADWKEKGAPNYINLCENDASGGNICHCEECQKLDTGVPADAIAWWPNWYADRYIRFCHRVLEKAKKINPNVKATTYAYNAMERPPVREKVTDDIVVGIVPTIFTRDVIRNFISGWKKAGMKEFFDRPNRRCYYAPPVVPVGFERYFYDIFRITYDAGDCIGFDHDGGTPETFGAFPDYVLAKTMQDPTKSFEHWEDHYFDAFGPAKKDVMAYYRYWREEVWEKRLEKDIQFLTDRGRVFNFTRGLLWNLDKYYKASDFTTARKFLEAAAKREGYSPSQKALVDHLLDAHEYAEIWARAIIDKDEDNTRALLDYRRNHKQGPLPVSEKYFGDLCGVMRTAVPAPANFHPDTETLVIVDLGHPEATAELKKHLDLQLSADIPVVKKEKDVTEGKFAIYVGLVPHDQSPHIVDFMMPEEGSWIFPNKGKLKTGYFYGPNDKAVRNAVHDFVEFELGARWPWGDEIAIKKQPDLRVYTWKNTWRPQTRLVKRFLRFADAPESEIFADRHRNGEHPAPTPGNSEGVPSVATPVKFTTLYRVGGEEEAFNEWQARYNETEAFSFEYELPAPKSVFDWHTAYIINKAMLDPYKSFGYWESHYLQSFGAAAREMRKFFQALREKKDGSEFLESALKRIDLDAADRARVEKVKADYAKVKR